MKKSILTTIVVILLFVTLTIFGLYINVINKEPNYKTYLFVLTIGGLWYLSNRLVQSYIKDIETKTKEREEEIRKKLIKPVGGVNRVTGSFHE